MKFYNREKEIEALCNIEDLSSNFAQMSVVVGRRRVGKTTLLKKSFEDKTMLYLFIAKKSEILLCQELVLEIKNKLDISLGEFKSFAELFRAIMHLSKERHFSFVIDEFQEFTSINSSIYSDMQNIWDSNKDESKINLVLCGSIRKYLRTQKNLYLEEPLPL